MDRADFQRLAIVRLDEAHALYAANHFSGSYYLGGYAVECALKACIAKNIRAEEWPEKGFSQRLYTHEPPALLKLAGLDDGQGQPNSGAIRYWRLIGAQSKTGRSRRETSRPSTLRPGTS